MARSFLDKPERWQLRCRLTAFASSVLALASLCNGCTWVEIQSGEGQVRIERHLGFVSLELPPDAPSRVVHLTGVGLVSLGFDTTLGYADATLVTLGYDCRLLVWIDNPDQIDHLRSLVGTTYDICMVTQNE